MKKKPKDQIEESMKKHRTEAKNGKRKFKDKELEADPPKLTSLQKLHLKKKSKQRDKDDEKSRAFAEYQHEVIKFGETAQAPPTLITPRRAVKDETVPRPGKRDLLLTSMLKNTSEATATMPNKINRGPIDKKGKRKNLPNSTRLALERERLNAVDLYRQLKKKKPIVLAAPNKNLDEF